jgi:ubiquinone/menaquinone biosynthesis C-methylase UbiE
MKNARDNFSEIANAYSKYRPHYPVSLYHFIYRHVYHFDTAWDCGTGNGQVAAALAEHFTQVYATDLSEQQLANAIQKDNIFYKTSRAEKTDFGDNSFDLITVGQAIHWFDFEAFYKEVNRVARPDAIIAAWTYSLIRADPETNAVIDNFYTNIIGPYWDPERKYIDEAYTTIPFPFEELPAPELEITDEWTLQHLLGYLDSWSAVQHYKEKNDSNPIDQIRPALAANWDEGEYRKVSFPIHMRIGRIRK